MAWRLGVVGHGIGYSLSPQIFEWFFRAANLNGTYRVWDVPPSALKSVLAEGEWDGLNVTVPFKTDVLSFCEDLSEAARRAAAVNTLRHSGGHLCGENTDGEGFVTALRSLVGEDAHFERALIIGSGGAAKACALALLNHLSTSAISLVSRKPETARAALPDTLNSLSIIAPQQAAPLLDTFDLVVQATPVGSVNMPGVPLPLPFTFREQAVVMDLIYAPRETGFLRRAKENGARAMNGLPMLIAQAAASLKLWTGVEISVEKAMTELLPKLEAA